MEVWIYYKDNDDSVGIPNVEFFNHSGDGMLVVKHFNGSIEQFVDVDYISNVYDSKFKHKHHEILPWPSTSQKGKM